MHSGKMTGRAGALFASACGLRLLCGMFTANSMNCICEALGMALGSGRAAVARTATPKPRRPASG